MQLSAYLDDVAGRTCAYGQLDCAILMADWVMANGYPDPMADRRGSYATEADYRAAIDSEGGIVASCRRRFAAIGLEAVERSRAGDVVLALAPVRLERRIVRLPTGAIAVSGGLLALLDWPRGIVCARLEVAAAWRVAGGDR